MILECRRALPPFVVAMEEGLYGLWRLRVNDDDDADDDDDIVVVVVIIIAKL